LDETWLAQQIGSHGRTQPEPTLGRTRNIHSPCRCQQQQAQSQQRCQAENASTVTTTVCRHPAATSTIVTIPNASCTTCVGTSLSSLLLWPMASWSELARDAEREQERARARKRASDREGRVRERERGEASIRENV